MDAGDVPGRIPKFGLVAPKDENDVLWEVDRRLGMGIARVGEGADEEGCPIAVLLPVGDDRLLPGKPISPEFDGEWFGVVLDINLGYGTNRFPPRSLVSRN
jgi:hypothetical protein